MTQSVSAPGSRGTAGRGLSSPRAAFTLLEVMIALAIFFMAIFTILELTSRSLNAARSLRYAPPDIGSLAAELSLTNSLVEGFESGTFGDLYPGYTWSRDVFLAGSNGLFQVEFTMYWEEDRRPKQSHLSVLYYRPQSQVRGLIGGGGPGGGSGIGRRR